MSCIGKTNDLKRSFEHDLIFFLANQKAFLRGAAVDRLGDKKKRNKVSRNDSAFLFLFHHLVGSPLSSPEGSLCVVGRLWRREKKIAIFSGIPRGSIFGGGS